jgi:sec-independent protein translocase protein TatA
VKIISPTHLFSGIFGSYNSTASQGAKMFGLGPTELIIIAVIVLFIFGAKRLPDIGKGLGGALREFRNIKKEVSSNNTDKTDQDEKETSEGGEAPKSIEAKVGEKILEQIPGVKKVMDVKKKAEKVKKFIE